MANSREDSLYAPNSNDNPTYIHYCFQPHLFFFLRLQYFTRTVRRSVDDCHRTLLILPTSR